jgi:hypothetical protein
MAKNIKKISDKLTKVSDSYTVNMYDNGFMLEITGRDKEDNWSGAKIIVSTIDELLVLINEIAEMERD